MKMLVGFLIGIIACLLILAFTGNAAFTARADEDLGLSAMLPDIGKIYRSSLSAPFQQVEKEIYDEDIANFYRELMQETGLDAIGTQ